VKEYLLSGRILCSKRVSKFSLTELTGNALILECSLLYVFNAVDIDEIVSVSETKPATTTSKSHAIPKRYLAAAAHQQEMSPVEKFPLRGYWSQASRRRSRAAISILTKIGIPSYQAFP